MPFFTVRTFATITISLLLSSILPAQDNLADKIEKLDGDVSKISITIDGEEYTFEGDDANKLFKKMKKTYSKHSYAWHSSGEGERMKKLVLLNSDGEEHCIEIFDEDDEEIIILRGGGSDCEFNEMHKKIKVEVENGDKKVTVTTKENGEEKTEVYEGEEADTYLEEMKSEHGEDLEIIIKDDGDKKKIRIEKKVENEE